MQFFCLFIYSISTSKLAEDLLYDCILIKIKNAVPLILPQLKNLNHNSLAFIYHNFLFFIMNFNSSFHLWKVHDISFILLDKIGKTYFNNSIPQPNNKCYSIEFLLEMLKSKSFDKTIVYFNQLHRLKFIYSFQLFRLAQIPTWLS